MIIDSVLSPVLTRLCTFRFYSRRTDYPISGTKKITFQVMGRFELVANVTSNGEPYVYVKNS